MHSNKVLVTNSAINSAHSHSRFLCQRVLPALSSCRLQSQLDADWSRRRFHTSRKVDLWLPPITRVIVKQLEKFVPAFKERKEKQEASTDTTQQQEGEETQEKKSKWPRYIAIFVVQFVFVWSAFNYLYHYERTLCTGRDRYVPLTIDQSIHFAEYQLDALMQKHKNQILDASDPAYEKMDEVVKFVVGSNHEWITEQNWKVVVIDSDDSNIEVFQTGHVVVDRGLVEMTKGYSFLVSVVAHAIAHAGLNHTSEKITEVGFQFNLLIFLIMQLYGTVPKSVKKELMQWVFNLAHGVIDVPHSGHMEREADQVALYWLANACFDVREFSNMYRLLDVMRYDAKIKTPSYLTQHPNFADRIELTDKTITQALDTRCLIQKCLRQPLSLDDPRENMRLVHDELMRQRNGHLRAKKAKEAAEQTQDVSETS